MSLVAIGCDVGNNTVKLKTKKDFYYIDTLVKKPIESRKIFGRGDSGEPVNYLDVDIESEGVNGNYYIGNLASRGNGSQESIGGLKSENVLLKVAALTSIAYVLTMEDPARNEFEVALGTGLPVREFFWKNEKGEYDFKKVKSYINQLSGCHSVKFNTKLLGQRKITFNIDKNYIETLPECYAGLLTIVNDVNGSIKSQFAKDHIKVMGADLGGGSSDMAGYCNDNYIDECMFGFDLGINEAQDRVCEDIKVKANLKSFTRHELNKYIFDKELDGKMETNRGTFDLNEEKIRFYKPLSEKLVYNFRKNLSTNEFDISRINHLFLFGGASKEIGEMVKEELKNDIRNIEIVPDSITRNVEAYYNAVKEYEE